MAKKSIRLSLKRWSLWVDSRYRMTIPKALMTEVNWRVGDTLLFTSMKDGSVQVRSLDRDLRVCLVELEELRAASPRSPRATRVDALALEIASLTDHLFPLDQSSLITAFAQQAIAETQTRERLRKNKVTDRVDAILMSLESRKAIYAAIQDLKRPVKRRKQG